MRSCFIFYKEKHRNNAGFGVSQTPNHYYNVQGIDELYFDSEGRAAVELKGKGISFFLKKWKNRWKLHNFSEGLYINDCYLSDTEIILQDGDEIGNEEHTIRVYEKELHITDGMVISTNLVEIYHSTYAFFEEYPDFHRSPRIIYREPEEKITINTAPSLEKEKQGGQLAKLIIPPLSMMGVTVGMSLFMGRGAYVLMAAGTTVLTIIISVHGYFKEQKKKETELKEKKEQYEEYLVKKAIEVNQVSIAQRQGQIYHYPDIQALLEIGKSYSARIYEKTRMHFDFLYYRLGLGEVKSSSDIQYSNTEQEKKGDDLDMQGYLLYQNNSVLKNMPITSNLMSGPVGYVGPRKLVLEQLHLLINQLTVFHSYHDLQLVSIFPEEEKNQWEWMKWYRHATFQDMNIRGFVYNQRSRDQVLNSLNQILKSRKNQKEELNSRDGVIFTPHYLVMITDEKLILDHVIMEFFNEDPTELGCSVIYVQDVMSSLSDNVKTVIDIRDRNTGVLVMEKGNLKNQGFVLDHFPAGFDKEQLPRTLAGLNHLQNLKSSIPESVTFLELYQVERFEELNVISRWEQHSPHKSLAVPLGLRGKDDVVYLNLHEKAHGPHGLVAGTTGSGKSEIIQSYIISLAVNFHPYDVAFLLIDYKGGGMANLFRNLPHLLGTITNLDGAQSMRALISINAELKRRQRLFSENNVNHINQYQKLYKNGDVAEPMPHLFLISDEFAELKAEQPEFMTELVSTARIGRSLGIHLILATQKPSGVVNDQIWSNSKFKLALKVADRSDSMEMIKTPDAADITQAGRAYLQVGNNEIYELFQSAWSGADYQPDKDEQNIEDHTIYKVNELGQYEILSEDLSGLENAEEIKQIPTELDAIVDGIHELVDQLGIESLPSPWLPPLPEKVYLEELHKVEYKEEWKNEKSPLRPVIGMVDIPSMQAQETLQIDLSKDGHIAVYASPGYGKSTFVQTVIMDLARSHNPGDCHVYLLDFGTNGLLPLKKLPHVADTMSIDEEEKVGKFIRRIEGEIKNRKKLLKEYSVASLEMYERASKKTQPAIFIAVDGYEGLKGTKFEEVLDKLLIAIAREGAGIGIHLIITAGRQGSMRMNLYSNIKLQIALKLIDEGEARNIVGRTQLSIEDQPGRGLIKLEEPQSFQSALPAKGEEMLEVIEEIQREAQEMAEAWGGEKPEEIPMVPEEVTKEMFHAMPSVQRDMIDAYKIPIGIDIDSVQSMSWNALHNNLLHMGTRVGEGEAFVRGLLEILVMKKKKVLLFDTMGSSLVEEYEKINAVATNKTEYHELLEVLGMRVNERRESYEAARKENIKLLPAEYYKTLGEIYVILSGVSRIITELDVADAKLLAELLSGAREQGIYFISTTEVGAIVKGYDEVTKILKASNASILRCKLNDQTVLKASNKSYKEENLGEDEAYYILDEYAYKIKMVRE